MDSQEARRRRRSVVRRAWLHCLVLALPALALRRLRSLSKSRVGLAPALLLAACLLLYLAARCRRAH